MSADDIPRLSPSTAKILLQKSALHAWTFHRLGGDEQAEDTEEATRGRVLDRMLFGCGPEIVVVDAKDWRTNAAKEARDIAVLAGKLPVLVGKLSQYDDVINAWRSQLEDEGIQLAGKSQVKIDWESNGVPCRGRLDHLIIGEDRIFIFDGKSCQDASDSAIQRSVVAFGSDIQHAAYVEGVQENNPDMAGRVDFRFIYAEVRRPYAINVQPLAGTMRELGERKWKRAKRMWGECLRTNKFPGYQGTRPISATAWQLAEEQEREMPDSDNATLPF